MKKILVLVYIPLLEKKYDIYIPVNKKIGTIKNAIITSLSELTEGEMEKIKKLKIYDKESTMLYDNNLFVKESGIINGSKLLLM